jgi:hypothetical protein
MNDFKLQIFWMARLRHEVAKTRMNKNLKLAKNWDKQKIAALCFSFRYHPKIVKKLALKT